MMRISNPDPFVQAPGNWLNYNRYSYCWNNPLRYTDPSGEWVDNSNGSASVPGLGSDDGRGVTSLSGSGNSNNYYGIYPSFVYSGVTSFGSQSVFASTQPNYMMGAFHWEDILGLPQGRYYGDGNGNLLSEDRSQIVISPIYVTSENGQWRVDKRSFDRAWNEINDSRGGNRQWNYSAFSQAAPTNATATAIPIALTAAAVDGPFPVGDVVGGLILTGAILYDWYQRHHGTNSWESIVSWFGKTKYGQEAEHTSGARPSTLNKHQQGQARKAQDKGGEKGDVRRKRYK